MKNFKFLQVTQKSIIKKKKKNNYKSIKAFESQV